MKIKLTLILSLLSLAAPLANAGGGKPHAVPADVLAKYDTDKDGVLSETEKAAMKAAIQAEEAAKRAEFIAKYDTNGDGVLDATERAAAKTALEAEKAAALLAAQTAKFTALDTDGTPGLSAAEWAAGAPTGADAAKVSAAFTALDADKDGTVTLAEFTAARPGHSAPKGKGKGK